MEPVGDAMSRRRTRADSDRGGGRHELQIHARNGDGNAEAPVPQHDVERSRLSPAAVDRYDGEEEQMHVRQPRSSSTYSIYGRPSSLADTYESSGLTDDAQSDDQSIGDWEYGQRLHGGPATAVDFGSVALYIAGMQTTLAIVLCCLTSVLASFISVVVSVSAVRTATLSALVGMLFVVRPLRIAHVRGLDVMFDALRPAIGVYVLAIVLEQLMHSCTHVPSAVDLLDGAGGDVRHALYHVLTAAMALSGFLQGWTPRAHSDYPHVAVGVSLVCIASFAPPPVRPGEGPLCEPPSTPVAVERIFRALLFGLAYCALAYASEPRRHSVREVILCAVRATSGSVWILCVHKYVMWLAVPQLMLVTWSRVRSFSEGRGGGGGRYALRFRPLDTHDDADDFAPSVDASSTPAHGNSHTASRRSRTYCACELPSTATLHRAHDLKASRSEWDVPLDDSILYGDEEQGGRASRHAPNAATEVSQNYEASYHNPPNQTRRLQTHQFSHPATGEHRSGNPNGGSPTAEPQEVLGLLDERAIEADTIAGSSAADSAYGTAHSRLHPPPAVLRRFPLEGRLNGLGSATTTGTEDTGAAPKRPESEQARMARVAATLV